MQIVVRQEAMMDGSHANGDDVPLGPPRSAAQRAPAGVYNASNMSTRCFVFP